MTNGRSCTFNLLLDHEESAGWGTGLVDLFYRCAPRKVIHSSCNSGAGTGGIMSTSQRFYNNDRSGGVKVEKQQQPVLVSTSRKTMKANFSLPLLIPKYYKGGRQCRWTLRSEPGQRIQLRVLDVSLREGLGSNSECSDIIKVSERGKTLLKMCGESRNDIILLTHTNKFEVRKLHTLHTTLFYVQYAAMLHKK